jgi:hypothetical protein
MQAEFENVQNWARQNKMTIHLSKIKEIDFHRPHPSKFSLLPAFDNKAMVWQTWVLYLMISHHSRVA